MAQLQGQTQRQGLHTVNLPLGYSERIRKDVGADTAQTHCARAEQTKPLADTRLLLQTHTGSAASAQAGGSAAVLKLCKSFLHINRSAQSLPSPSQSRLRTLYLWCLWLSPQLDPKPCVLLPRILQTELWQVRALGFAGHALVTLHLQPESASPARARMSSQSKHLQSEPASPVRGRIPSQS